MNSELQVNDFVRYGINGICKIIDVKIPDFCRTSELYYVLQPISEKKSLFYIPKNNKKLISGMTSVPNRKKLTELVLSTKNNKTEWINDRIARGRSFQEILKTSDEAELLKLINTIYLKKQELLGGKKKLCVTDERVLAKAEKMIDEEFSFILEIPKEDVGKYIKELLEVSDTK